MTRAARVSPALSALTYPLWIWCGPAISPVFLLVALAVPALALRVLRQTPTTFVRARAVALAAIAAPPLYSWLGGLLDFQQALPFNSLGVWYPLWMILAVVVFAERPRDRVTDASPSSRLAFAHGLSAAVISIFAAAHVINHLVGLAGGAQHIAVMSSLRLAYREPLVECVLLGCVAFQVGSGLWLVRRKVRRGGDWFDTLQIASGAYLTAFFLSHLTAVLRARYLRGIDTNWVWLTADSMVTDPWSARLAPYYFLGVIAFGVHASLGLRQVLLGHGQSRERVNRLFVVMSASAVTAAVAIMAGLL